MPIRSGGVGTMLWSCPKTLRSALIIGLPYLVVAFEIDEPSLLRLKCGKRPLC